MPAKSWPSSGLFSIVTVPFFYSRAPPSPMNPLQRPIIASQSSNFITTAGPQQFTSAPQFQPNFSINVATKSKDKIDLSSFDSLLELKSTGKQSMTEWSRPLPPYKPIGNLAVSSLISPPSEPLNISKTAAKSASSELSDLLS